MKEIILFSEETRKVIRGTSVKILKEYFDGVGCFKILILKGTHFLNKHYPSNLSKIEFLN